jgi:predicted esterase
MIEQHLTFSQTRRYYQNDLKGKKKILIALHGYGQLAQFFFRKFNFLNDHWGVVVPEGPHRFYLNGSSGRVGASWMTKEWREQDILENNAYLQKLLVKILEENPHAKIHLLGFSQGGATAARFYQSHPNYFQQLILWASVFPPDIDKNEFPKGAALHFAIGENDPYFDKEGIHFTSETYQHIGFKVSLFEGHHDLHTPTLRSILTDD